MYWIIGDEADVRVPGDIGSRLSKLRGLQKDFARGIVLIDVSSTQDNWGEIGEALKNNDVPHAVVLGEMKTEWGRANESTTRITMNVTGMYTWAEESDLHQYKELDLNQYKAVVEGVADHVASLPTRERPSIPGSVPISDSQGGLDSESGSYSGGGSLGTTWDSTPRIPSVPPVSLDARVTTSTGSSFLLPQWGGPLED